MHTAVEARESRDRFKAPEEYAGYGIYPEGRRMGSVKELFANAYDEPEEYVRVKIGLLGLRFALIPIGVVAVNEERRTPSLQ